LRTRVSETRTWGYTLTEVILAMAVMAVAVPLVLGLVVASGESSRQAERETRAVITARSVFEELRRAQEGSSDLIRANELPWGSGPLNTFAAGVGGGGAISGPSGSESGGGEWLILELDRGGEILGLADDMEYEERWDGEDSEVVAIAAVRGYLQEVENVELVAGEPLRVFRVELRIESPARAAARDRESLLFLKTDSLR
jgi:type II secretory pathway pseudopilin PulG